MSAHHRLADWTVAMQQLDREAGLYPVEAEVLQASFTVSLSSPTVDWSAQPVNWENLDRLVKPIQQALLYCGQDKVAAGTTLACCHHLLREMHIRQVSLWAWKEAEWLDIIGLTKQAFVLNRGGNQLPHVTRPAMLRQHLMSCAYLLGGISIYTLVGKCQPVVAASQIFGSDAIRAALCSVKTELQRGGWSASAETASLASCISKALLFNRSPHLEDLTFDSVNHVYHTSFLFPSLKRGFIIFSRALHSLTILPQPLALHSRRWAVRLEQQENLAAAWKDIIERWSEATCCGDDLRNHVKSAVAKAARWSASQPIPLEPRQWDKLTALQFVSAVKVMKIGQWTHPKLASRYKKADQDMKPGSKAQLLNYLRRFFADCHEWELLPRLFNTTYHLATPSSIRNLCGIKPRVINLESWKRLLQASLTLTPEDMTSFTRTLADGRVRQRETHYPFEMVRAMAIVWLLAGLRSDELTRLPVGCISKLPVLKGYSVFSQEADVPGVCYLRVPVHKTGKAFDKSVDQRVGDAILAWEKVRPVSPALRDEKTNEQVHFLFKWRGRTIGTTYINHRLIPMLCRKAGISIKDEHGLITSHRARTTLATQMFLSNQMGLMELQKWLGHKSLRNTLYYIDVPPERMLQSFTKANAYISKRVLDLEPTDDSAGKKQEKTSNSSPTFSHIIESISTLEQICSSSKMSDKELRSVKESILALKVVAERLQSSGQAA